VLAGAERFLVEFLRRNERIVVGLTLPQLIGLAMVIGGTVWLLRLRSAGGVPAPARS
jgi:phosphatidylglycerol:prolipoprotein diacylglycerol transferase